MKLRGSRVEKQMRDELVRSNRALQDGSYGEELTKAMKLADVDARVAFVLNWIPEQGEDIYTILVEPDAVLIVEVVRRSGDAVAERENLAKYVAKCSKIQRLKVAVAMDLLANKKSGIYH